MGFNYAKEKKEFDKEWKALQKEYEDAGMTLPAIEAMRTYDWEHFLSRRAYENHTQPLPEAFLCGDEDGQRDMLSALVRRFSALTTSFDVEDFHGRFAWIDTIDNASLHSKLARLSIKDLELLTFVVLEGHDQCELAQRWHSSQSAISQRLKKIKKILK